MSADARTVAVVTGGASGIGLALVKAYAAAGLHVVIADVDARAAARAADEVSRLGGSALPHAVDLRDGAAVDALVELASGIGPIGAACLNAGATSTGTVTWETAPEVYDFLFGVNVFGLANSLRSFVPVLIDQAQPADLVITASMAGLMSSPSSGCYSASKAAAIALAKAARDELATISPQIRVALLNPGAVKTNLMRTSDAAQSPAVRMGESLVEASHDALNAMGVEPEEVAEWVFDALGAGEFWVFPPPDDPFGQAVAEELTTIRKRLTA